MKKFFVMGLLVTATSFLLLPVSCLAQKGTSAKEIDAIINAKEVERIERTLSADDMQGRKTFTPGIEKAADFIASEFKAIGLQTCE